MLDARCTGTCTDTPAPEAGARVVAWNGSYQLDAYIVRYIVILVFSRHQICYATVREKEKGGRRW